MTRNPAQGAANGLFTQIIGIGPLYALSQKHQGHRAVARIRILKQASAVFLLLQKGLSASEPSVLP